MGEPLEARIALSVTTYTRERVDEQTFTGGTHANQPGEVLIASDLGSDVYIQQLQTTPSELLVADNGSFLDYVAFEDVDNQFDEILVTNGTLQQQAATETITADSWWLFPSATDTTNFNTTKLALDRPFLETGASRDFFGSVHFRQGDGTISTWTFSAWNGSGNVDSSYRDIGENFYITGGPGFGGRSESFRRQTVTPVQALPTGYVFPRSIRVEAEGIGARRYYLAVEWSQTPAVPPVINANYYGWSHLDGFGNRQNVRDPFSSPPAAATIGLAMRTARLDVTLPDAIAGSSEDRAASLGVVPGTLSGTLVIGARGQDQFVTNFEDRRNDRDFTTTADLNSTGYTLFFDNPDGRLRQFGLLEEELTPGISSDLDFRFREGGGEPNSYLEGRLVDQSQLQFVIGSSMSDDPGYSGSVRELDGINVPLAVENLGNETTPETATDAVRVQDLRYAVFVKPTVPNEVIFAPGATVTRSVTVDLLTEGSTLRVNSPIDVANPAGDLDFRATNIEINAPTSTPDYFFVGRSESTQSGRLPRDGDPQGGLQTTPTFGAVLPETASRRTVVATPVLNAGAVEDLVVLPGNEGYGYDPLKPPTISLANAVVQEADIDVLTVSGGVGDLTLLNTGTGYPNQAEDIVVEIDDPQLRRVDELRRWTTSPLPEGYALEAAPVLAISQPEVVASQVRVGYGERARAEVVVGNALRAALASGGSNYSEEPTIDIVLTAAAEAQGLGFFDPASDPRYRQRPSFDLSMAISTTVIPVKNQPPQIQFNSGRISGLTVLNPGFGLNYTTPEEFEARYEFVISDGVFDAAQQAAAIAAKTASGYIDFPTAANHGTVSLSPLLGTLAWTDNWSAGSGVSLLEQGKNYNLSPDIQFVGRLTADVRIENGTDEDADGSSQEDPVVVGVDNAGRDPVAEDLATHAVSVFNVAAFADGTDASRFPQAAFRESDYLSYINDPLYADAVMARVSLDGENFYPVEVGGFAGIDGQEQNLDEYTGQLGVRSRDGEAYPSPTGGELDESNFEAFINAATNVEIYFHESFVGLEITAPGEAYAVMGKDPARGRAVSSEGEITNIEVTYAGSGYTQVPGVSITYQRTTTNDQGETTTATVDGGAEALATVVGGVYELSINSPGFNYLADLVPGAGEGVLRNEEIDVFGESTVFGVRNPVVDFAVRNSALQGGNVFDPGDGLRITGNPGSTELVGFDATGVVIPGNNDGAGSGTPAEFKAIISADGRIASFEKIDGGSGFSLAPQVTVEPPPSPANGTARAVIDASRGIVSGIEVVDSGLRYSVPPLVVVRPPNPRGEGVAARAEAVLDQSGAISRIVVTDGGSGYVAPPEVLVQPRFNYAVSESLDVASSVTATHYELYLTDSEWTDRPRGELLLRPESALSAKNGNAQTIYMEASAADIIAEGDLQAEEIMILANSRDSQQTQAPYTITTRSRATGEQSGAIRGGTLSVTLGNDTPTPVVGAALSNSVDIRTAVTNLRVTAAESATDPRGAFPYELLVEEVDDLIVDAVPRTGGTLAFTVAEELQILSRIRTDGDVAIVAGEFSQSAPVVTTNGVISVEATSVAVNNSLQVLASPFDEERVDIRLTSKAGDIQLTGLVEAPNAIELRQQGNSGKIFGASRVATDRLRVEADGDVDLTTAVRSATISSETGGVRLSEFDDVNVERVTAPAGTVSLSAEGVDRGGDGENPVALTARVVEAQAVEFSTPNGSMEVVLDTSRRISLGDQAALTDTATPATPMRAAGNVVITSTAGGIDLFDGPVAGRSARVVRVATTGPLDARATYQGNTPGAFPSTLSGAGKLPAIDGVVLSVGDRILIKDQSDLLATDRFDESRANGIYVVTRLGGGDAGFRDWQLKRADDADTRDDLLPGSYVRVIEGDSQSSAVFQFGYADVPALRVSRTVNNQLVVAGSTGGLLNLEIDDLVSGDGIVPGARVTAIDFANGVVSLGVGNRVEIEAVTIANQELQVATSTSGYLFDAIEAARARSESVLISGDGIRVGATVESVDRNGSLLRLSAGGIEDADEVSAVTIGFVQAASGRTSLNPAVRSFLISDVLETTNGSTITLSDQFTNYGSLREGQLVFGDGVKPNTVITRVLPALRQVQVSPGGLPEAIDLAGIPGITGFQTPSLFYGEGFEDYLQMPGTFNDFARLTIGQRVTGTGLADSAVITAIDPVYRQIGLSDGSVLAEGATITDLVFESLKRVDFGMVTDLGTGTASFSVTPFGYGGTVVTTPRLGSGLATVGDAAAGAVATELRLEEFTDESVITKGNPITGVGLRNGYRVWDFDGRNIQVYSAEIVAAAGSTVTVDDDFAAFGELRAGMSVTGPDVSSGTTIIDFDSTTRTITLSQAAGNTGYLIFGSPFTPSFTENEGARSSITVHRQTAAVSSSVSSQNPQAEIRYQVTTDGVTADDAGSLAAMLLLAQRNESRGASSVSSQSIPVVTFADGIAEIRLQEPLPSIETRPLVIDGTTTIDGELRAGTVAIDGRLISTTEAGAPVLPATVVDGLAFNGLGVSGSVVKGIRLGGFNNGAAIRIDGTSDILVDNVQIGLTATGGRAGADYGVLITGDDATGNTILNSSIVGASRAGIRVEEEATGTRVVGTTVGSEAILNTVGVEVAASGTLLGATSIHWRSTSGAAGSLTPQAFQAELRAGQREIPLTATATQWQQLVPGLAVVGNGLPVGSRIVSVDAANEVVVLNQAVTRNVPVTDSNLLIGYAGEGLFGTDKLALDASVPLDQVFLGQEVRLVGGESTSDVFVTTIAGLDRVSRTVTLADEFADGGLYGQGVRLVEFTRPAENRIQFNGSGVVVGLFLTASGSAGQVELTVPSTFVGWQSIRQGMAVFGEGIAAGATVTDFDAIGRTVTLSSPLTRSLRNTAIRFAAADNFQMVNTSVVSNVGDGLVLGGGKDHSVGQSMSLTTYASAAAAEAAAEEGEAVFELVSWETTSDLSVTGDIAISDARLGEALEGLDENALAQISVYGTAIPEGTTVESYNNGVVGLSAGEGIAFTETDNATIYFGLGRYVTASPSQAVVGRQVEGEGITEFTRVTATRAPAAVSAEGEAGYLAISLPQAGLPSPFGLNVDWPEIRLVNRGQESNVFALNGGYGITVKDVSADTKLYDDVLPTWLIAGNFIDVAFNRNTGGQSLRQNTAGALSPAIFAELFNDENGNPQTESVFDKTDSFGNQYRIQLTDFNQPEDDNPFQPEPPVDDGGGTGEEGPVEEGDPPAPEDDLWPGVPF